MPPKPNSSDQFAPRRAVEVLSPELATTPLIFASPHSGRDYPGELLRNTRLDRHALRQSEDSYVDLLFDEAPRFGAPLLRALFPRAFVDVNRARDELDPRMFSDDVPKHADTRSSRVIAGLGVIPRIVADGQDIYSRKLYYFDARRRLAACYDPYHAALRRLIDDARSQFGVAVLIDCHSMPSAGGAPFRAGEPRIDFVLGDRFGSSCDPSIVAETEDILRGYGYQVARNAPYAGGYVASSYGRPREGVHVLQIEINRALYLDERRIARTGDFETLRLNMTRLIERLVTSRGIEQRPPQAAE
ncbi:N-formylglutamate amidohydrolase [Hyphococcus flavus]|uniref:N-formylglutamate amidohydrolase n=1 Tax=Hyphococcus flavus TaxID=1866326 RepID=A0AAE9ZKK2_9PROT|nr:N-formylglutamate amidohydrolase [Hyphococcus flavus]WDI32340.1 N-formylglutamate amidohydrolase [Hyphococcus flavus]